jgi:hypothetical protein
MAVTLDPVGNTVLSLQIVILFLLILGLPFVKGRDSKRNVARHGYLTAVALILHTVLIFIVMIPSFNTNFGAISNLSILESIDVWSHAMLGTIAEVSGIILVGLWMFKAPSKMTCMKRKKWMMPIFVIWTISLINGALIHIIGII